MVVVGIEVEVVVEVVVEVEVGVEVGVVVEVVVGIEVGVVLTRKEKAMRQIEISEETYSRIKSQLGDEIVEIDSYQDLVGKKFFFRTVTYHLLGKVTKQVGDFLQLETASWVADSKRFKNFIKDGKIDNAEIEPVGVAFVNLKSVTDFFPWRFPLPTKQQ